MKKILLIDGNSIANRAYYGIPPLSSSKGVFTNAVYGFMNIFLKNLEREDTSYVMIAFDLKAPTFRHKEYSDYKATRKAMPNELGKQLVLIKDLLRAMTVPIVECEGYEADDILGTLAKYYEERDFEVTILTGDRDLLQLATENVVISLVRTKAGMQQVDKFYRKDVIEKLGVTPKEYIEVKGLMGDASDNIPGIKGVGEKTAFSLIKEYKSLEGIYSSMNQITAKKLKENLINGKEMAFMSRSLATIVTEVPIEVEEAKLKNIFNKEVYEILKELELRILLERMKKDYSKDLELDSLEMYKEPKNITIKSLYFETVTEKEKVMEIASKLSSSETVFYKLFNIDKEFAALSVLHNDTIYWMEVASILNGCVELKEDVILEAFKNIFEDEKIQKVTHDIKEDMKYLAKYNIEINNYFDEMLAYYVSNPSAVNFEVAQISRDILGIDMEEDKEIFDIPENARKIKAKKKYTILELEENIKEKYITNILGTISNAYEELKDKIEMVDASYLFYEIENPLVKVLAEMEYQGVMIDQDELKKYVSFIENKANDLEREIYKMAGLEFNINSPKQLGEVLYDKLMLTATKKTQRGYSTSAETLDKLRGEHPIIDYILEYRQIEKLRTTYGEGLFEYIAKDGRIHTTFNQLVTATGRLSSTEPNLQNIPVRVEVGKRIRKIFIPSSDDYTLVDVDYSQIELRVLAHMSGDETLINAYKNGEDIHTLTASQVLGIPYDKVTKEERNAAKAVNFGIVYGISAFSLSNDIHVTKKQAEEYIDKYFSKYSKVKEYLDKLIKDAEDNGYSKTLFNRTRKIDELKATNYMQREFGKRIAMNSPIQGTAADIMKIAMIKLSDRIKKEKLDAKMLLTVHDELLIEVNKKVLKKAMDIIKYELENAASLDVPLDVTISSGSNWYEVK